MRLDWTVLDGLQRFHEGYGWWQKHTFYLVDQGGGAIEIFTTFDTSMWSSSVSSSIAFAFLFQVHDKSVQKYKQATDGKSRTL